MASLVFAAIGFMVGGPQGAQIGFMLGNAVGGSLFAEDTVLPDQQGPRLNDSITQNSTYGMDIPLVFNKSRLAGNIIWSTERVETAHTTTQTSSGGGKGGGGGGGSQSQTTTTYTYSVSLAIAICQGPITRVKKIFANSKLIYDADNGGGSDTIAIHLGDEAQTADSYIQAIEGIPYTPAYRGTAYVVFSDFQLASYGNYIPQFEFEVENEFTNLGSVVSYLCQLGGLTAGQIDVTQLTTPIKGYKVSNRGSIRSAIEPLASAFFFDAVESNQKIKFVARGTTTLADTLTEDDIDAREPGSAPGDLLHTSRKMEMELPYEILVSFANVNNSFLQGNQYARRHNTLSRSQVKVELPISLDPPEAKIIAHTMLNHAWTATSAYKFLTSRKKTELEPTDVINVITDGTSHVLRITKKDESSKGVIAFEGEPEDAGLWDYTDPGYINVPANIPFFSGPPGNTNVPVIFDSSADSFEITVAACGASADWGGCTVWVSLDGIEYTPYGVIKGASVMGVTTTLLAAVADPDTTSTLGVNMSSSHKQLLSVSQESSDIGVTTCYIGDEFITFKDSALVSADNYNLTNLHRGFRNTTPTSHAIGTPLVLLGSSNFTYSYVESQIGNTIYFKVTSFNKHGLAEQSEAAVTAYPFVITGPSGTPADVTNVIVSPEYLIWGATDDFAVKGQEIRLGGTNWETADFVARVDSTEYPLLPMPVGSYTFRVKNFYANGNLSVNASTATLVIVAPTAPGLIAEFVGPDLLLSITPAVGQYPIVEHETRRGAVLGSSTLVQQSKSTAPSLKADFAGAETFWVASIDSAGNISAFANVGVYVTKPLPPSIVTQVVDNNVLFFWADSTQTLPIEGYELRRGPTYASAAVIGTKQGLFTSLFETEGGVLTYWLAAIDSALNYGDPTPVSVTVASPPNYVLFADYDSPLAGAGVALSNALFSAGEILLPVNTTETWTQHFVNNGWASPQAQITAGFPIYIEPSTGAGSYVEEIDYGTVLAGSKVIVTPTGTVVDGTPVLTSTISVRVFKDITVTLTIASPGVINWVAHGLAASQPIVFSTSGALPTGLVAGTTYYVKSPVADSFNVSATPGGAAINFTGSQSGVQKASEPWTDYAGVSEIFAAGFRYVKWTLDVTSSGGNDIYKLTALNVKLSLSPANDSGSISAVAGDAGGTVVTFNTAFIDVEAITVNAQSIGASIPLSCIYDFADVPYPTDFKVLVFRTDTGARVSTTVSWTAKGY